VPSSQASFVDVRVHASGTTLHVVSAPVQTGVLVVGDPGASQPATTLLPLPP